MTNAQTTKSDRPLQWNWRHKLGIGNELFDTASLCEIDKSCQHLLGERFPGVEISPDITQFSAKHLRFTDIIVGGFPCQDISSAGKNGGIDGARSGLWWEMRRIIDEARPRWLLIENVSVLRVRGADEVLASLEEIGYTCWPLVVGAWCVGAPHKRDRVWIVGYYPGESGCKTSGKRQRAKARPVSKHSGVELADSDSPRLDGSPISDKQEGGRQTQEPESASYYPQWPAGLRQQPHDWEPDKLTEPTKKGARYLNARWCELFMGYPIGWTDCIGNKSALKGLGNSVVPWIVAIIGAAIWTIDNLIEDD